MARQNSQMAIDPRQSFNKKLMASLSREKSDELNSDIDKPFSENLFIKEKNVESSKRSLPSLESEEPMLSLVKMFIKLKAEGFDIRPTRNDKGTLDSKKMSKINPDEVMVCKSAPYNICYKVDQKAGKLIPISRNIKPVR